MKYRMILLLVASVLLGGCGTTSPNVMSDEDFKRVQN